MDILVFAAKDVGLNLTRFLLDTYPNDSYTFVVNNPGKDKLISFLKSRNINAFDVEDDAVDQLINSAKKYDWLLNLWGGYIFKDNLLSLAKKSLNIHPSYLPFGRGSDPVVWCIRNNWEAGATLHGITNEIDGGPIWAQKSTPYTLPITGGNLYPKVVSDCEDLFITNWSNIRAGTLQPIPQKSGPAEHKRKQLLKDRIIDLTPESKEWDTITKLLAHDFSPEYTSQLKIGGKIYTARLILEEIDP